MKEQGLKGGRTACGRPHSSAASTPTCTRTSMWPRQHQGRRHRRISLAKAMPAPHGSRPPTATGAPCR
eukprot:4604819-Pyramimonas_sp.AAC.1